MNRENRCDSVKTPSLDVLDPLLDTLRQLKSGSKTKEQLVAFNENRCFCNKKRVAATAVPFKYDRTADGWKFLEDMEFDGNLFVPDIVEFLKPGGLMKSAESWVSGDTMQARAKELNANLGQRHAEYLLEHQELIPKEWQGKYFLVFPGTVWQDSDGGQRVPCLRWSGGGWYPRFDWLGRNWSGNARLVSLRK